MTAMSVHQQYINGMKVFSGLDAETLEELSVSNSIIK
jgi:hypothetical protein